MSLLDEGYSETDESGSGQYNMDPHYEYEKMTHLNAHMYRDGYVMMVPVGGPPSSAGGETVQRPAVPSHYDVPADFCNKQVSNGDASSTPSPSPSKYENCCPLTIIEEAPRRQEHSDIYENFPDGPRLRNRVS